MDQENWTVASAWSQFHGSQKPPTPEEVQDENVTELDHLLAQSGIQASQEPDATKRAKIMHATLAYGAPYLTESKRKSPEGDKYEQLKFLKKEIIRCLREYWTYASEPVSEEMINDIKDFDFSLWGSGNWFDVFEALGLEPDRSHELDKFYEFACMNKDYHLMQENFGKRPRKRSSKKAC
jgi:hypothetical protein